jgi:hypothetical protein
VTARPFPVEVTVESDPGQPLSDVPVYLGTEELGTTGDDGSARVLRFDPPGTLLRFRCDCPVGFRASQAIKELSLKNYRAPDITAPLQIHLRCRPESRLAVFVVKARNGPHIEILLQGERVGRTDRDGVAHFSRRVAVGSEQVIELHAGPKLRPSRISHFFKMPDANELFVVDQRFDVWRPSRPRSARRRIIKIE